MEPCDLSAFLPVVALDNSNSLTIRMDAIELPLTNGGVTVIDESDGQLVVTFSGIRQSWTGTLGQIRWYGKRGRHTTYAKVRRFGKTICLHRLLFGNPPNVIDHKDGDGLNNRRSNLRVATLAQNLRNVPKRCGISSRFKGVRPLNNKWAAQIQFRTNGKKCFRHLGSFATEEDAARAYDRAALEHFGEFARLNFPQQQVPAVGSS